MLNDPTLTSMVNITLATEERKYIGEILDACSRTLAIKTYSVIREDSFDALRDAIDRIIEHNPMMELASRPIDLRFLNKEKWVAILVEYDDSKTI